MRRHLNKSIGISSLYTQTHSSPQHPPSSTCTYTYRHNLHLLNANQSSISFIDLFPRMNTNLYQLNGGMDGQEGKDGGIYQKGISSKWKRARDMRPHWQRARKRKRKRKRETMKKHNIDAMNMPQMNVVLEACWHTQ